MKIQQQLGTAAGVLLILLLASGAQAWTVVFDKTDLQRGTDIGMFPFEIVKGPHFKEPLPDVEFLVPLDVLALAVLGGKEAVGNPLLCSGMSKFQIAPGIFPANVLGATGGDSDLNIFRLLGLNRFRVKMSDEPVPAGAVLILVGLIALIALKGRRK